MFGSIFFFLIIINLFMTLSGQEAYFSNKFLVQNTSNIEHCLQFSKISQMVFLYGQANIYNLAIKVRNFNDFEQIRLDCISPKNTSIGILTLIPKRPIALSNNLNLNHSIFQINTITFKFIYINKIDSNLNIFHNFFNDKILIHIEFYYSTFGLEHQNLQCRIKNNFTIFKKVFSLTYVFTCIYTLNTCPLLFYNSDISDLNFNGLSNTIIKNNYFTFISINYDLNFKINKLSLSFYRGLLNPNLLDINVFKQVRSIYLYGQIKKIHNHIFENFTNLTEIRFFLDKLDVILIEGLDWLNSINSIINLNTIKIIINNYKYPNIDFCVFKKVPQNRHILFQLFLYRANCTCLILWLYKIYYFDDGLRLLNRNELCSNLVLLNSTCNFETIKCQMRTDFDLTKQDKLYESEILTLTSLILTPFFSIMGLFGNLLNILVLKMNAKLSNEKVSIIHKLMVLNSIVNFLYCLISLLHLMNICIGINGVYCPFISRSISVQIFEIYIRDYFGNILKTLSNFLCVGISLSRYGSLINRTLFRNIFQNKKILVPLIIVVFVLHLDKIFTSRIVYDNLLAHIIDDYIESPFRNTFINAFEKDKYDAIQRSPFSIRQNNPIYLALFCLNFLINDFLLFVILLITDLFLLAKFKYNLKVKRMIIMKNNLHNQDKIHKNEKTNFRVTVIILVNLNILLILRSLELVMNFTVFITKISSKLCDFINKFCTNYYETGNFFYLITCSYTTVAYYYLNNSFNNKLKCFVSNINLVFKNGILRFYYLQQDSVSNGTQSS
ncbi:unnamed protein product [Brachionus calyciflorus]|uniref:G-protein coupled receptors family 1 profile domain-containing protein n=1 Tax=Brachionus calyciflorus TaxID=104777 RepID=A0A814FBT5_9BILA|nr:unnamed protein product [Brachionus calyciflorus]